MGTQSLPRVTGRHWRPSLGLPSTVRGQLVLTFALLVAIIAAGAAGSAWEERAHRSSIAEMEQTASTVSLLQNAEGDAAYAIALLELFVANGDQSTIPQIRSNLAATAENLEKARAQEAAMGHAEDAARISGFASGAALASATAEQVIALREGGDARGATVALAAVVPGLQQMKVEFDETAASQREQAAAVSSQADRSGAIAFWFAIASGAMGVVLGLVASLLIARSILKPLRRLEQSARSIAGGNLTARAPEDGPREFRRLGITLNQMTEELLDASKRRELEEERERAHAELAAAREELAATGARLNSILGSIEDMVYSVSAQTLHTEYVSPAAQKLFGVSPQEMCENPRLWFEMVHPDDRPKLEEASRNPDGHGHAEVDFRVIRRDGSMRWLRNRANIVRDADGKPARIDGVCIDITERKQSEEALRQSEERFSKLFHASPVAMMISRASDRQIIDLNDSCVRVLGYQREELIGRPPAQVELWAHQDERDRVNILLESDGAVPIMEVTLVAKSGEHRSVLGSIEVVEVNGEDCIHSMFYDITDRKQAQEIVHFMAYHDPLTELPNRALFEDRFSVALAQARRAATSLCVMSVDLDRFKLINDTLGHAAGDEALKAAAQRLKELRRDGDTVARVGGDEFMILLAGDCRPNDGARVARKILRAFREPFWLQGRECHVTLSIGIAFYDQDGHDMATLVQSADAAMYRAKEMGRDTYQLYNSRMDGRAPARFKLENDLRRALEKHELEVYYQPQVSVQTGDIVGAEALVRWNVPGNGIVGPAEFIPTAEATGLIVPLGEWVLRQACVQAKAWQDTGLHIRMAVNISMRQFQHENFVETVKKVLRDTGLESAALELEITESTAMSDAESTTHVLRDLANIGIGMSIDDFGTGYSSLRYLLDLPIQAVKIDQSFIRDLTNDSDSGKIAGAIINLGHSLGLEVIAEGVETEESLSFLRGSACDTYQGYLCAKPMPAAAFEAMLLAHDTPYPKLARKLGRKNTQAATAGSARRPSTDRSR